MKRTARRRGTAAALTIAALTAGLSFFATPASAVVNAPGDVFHVGNKLSATQTIMSTNAQYYLDMREDGNLVILGNGSETPKWQSGTSGNPGAYFTLQSDDNAVIRSKDGKALWSSGTSKKTQTNGIVTLGKDGKLNVLDNAHKLRWQSHTTGTDFIDQGSSLSELSYLYSGSAKFTFQSDGNLVSTVGGKVVWSSHTQKRGGVRLSLQSDGNLILYPEGHAAAIWSTGTAGTKADKLTISSTGKLTLARGNAVIWKAP